MGFKNLDYSTRKMLDDAWLNLPKWAEDEDIIYNPLDNMPHDVVDEPHLYIIWLMSNPDYFSFFTKHVLNLNLHPSQLLILKEMWYRKFPMLIGSRGLGKTFLAAVYVYLRLIFLPKRKIVVAGAAFRQSKFIFEYMETIWNNAPILRDLCAGGGPSKDIDMWKFKLFDSTAVFIPIGTGEKIRGLRAHDIWSDEFSSINREIFETVLSGFAAVSSDPVESIKNIAAKNKAKKLNLWVEDSEDKKVEHLSNQIIISGTAYYQFGHFYQYWKKWHKIIESKGDKDKLIQAFGGIEKYNDDLSHTDYSIIRIPVEVIPEGFMDSSQIARSKATFDSSVFQMEFGACFAADSNGFFKRSLIESCVVNNETKFDLMPKGAEIFEASLNGKSGHKYVYGIDPASEIDNFSIVILELHNNHRRIVYSWTTNKKEFRARVSSGITKENEYYSYCARKIRELMKRFPTDHIAIDSQGGGYAVLEVLHDKDKFSSEDGELPIYEAINYNKPKDTDGYSGLHNVYMINFASSDYTRDANHGLKADLENKVLLFPFFDAVTLAEAELVDKITTDGIAYDSLDDCVMDIEELKDELASIILTQTPSGREHWDTPETKISGSKKGRMRKDRYSALLMANMLARNIKVTPQFEISAGGFAGTIKTAQSAGQDYVGPAWFTEKMRNIY